MRLSFVSVISIHGREREMCTFGPLFSLKFLTRIYSHKISFLQTFLSLSIHHPTTFLKNVPKFATRRKDYIEMYQLPCSPSSRICAWKIGEETNGGSWMSDEGITRNNVDANLAVIIINFARRCIENSYSRGLGRISRNSAVKQSVISKFHAWDITFPSLDELGKHGGAEMRRVSRNWGKAGSRKWVTLRYDCALCPRIEPKLPQRRFSEILTGIQSTWFGLAVSTFSGVGCVGRENKAFAAKRGNFISDRVVAGIS